MQPRTHFYYFLTEFLPPVAFTLLIYIATLTTISNFSTPNTKEPTMKVFLHPHNQAIIATDNDHAIYVPAPSPSNPNAQLAEAQFHLADCSRRCFDYSQDLSDLPPITPSQSCTKPDNHEPETPPRDDFNDPDHPETP